MSTVNVFIDTKIDGDVDYSLNTFLKKVKTILHSKKGWQLKNYKFFFISPSIFKRIPNNKKDTIKVILRLSTNETIVRECGFKEEERLSCYNPTITPANVCINFDRWMTGSHHSKLKLSDYRIYVINHEIGHALGRGHVKVCTCKTCPVPVMMQQTKSIGECKPNVWPLKDE